MIRYYRCFHALAGTSLILLCSLLMTSCAVITESGMPIRPVLEKACFGNVDLNGRFSVRYTQDGREEALHGNFGWRQREGHTAITLMSPLGQAMAVIEVTQLGATLTEAGKPPRKAQDADALAASELGWPLPVSGLREWLRGCAIDASGRRFLASPTNDSVTTLDGWRIHYVNWQDDGGLSLPRRIDFQRGEVNLRLIIDRPEP